MTYIKPGICFHICIIGCENKSPLKYEIIGPGPNKSSLTANHFFNFLCQLLVEIRNPVFTVGVYCNAQVIE